jgi:hypothetical protein
MSLSLTRLLPVVVIVPVLVFEGRFAWDVMLSDMIVFNIQRDMVFWGNNGTVPAKQSVAEVSSDMDRALALWQLNPDYLSLKARLQVWTGLTAGDNDASLAGISHAADTMHTSLQVRPANPYSWLQLAEYLRVLPGSDKAYTEALDKVRMLAPGDPVLQKRVSDLASEGR